MKKKQIILLSFLSFIFTSCLLNDLRNDLKKDKDSTTPKLTTEFKQIGSIRAFDTTEAIANAIAQIKIFIKLNSDKKIDSNNRKISITTTAGSFLVDGKNVNTAQINVDESNEAYINLVAPSFPIKGTITVSDATGNYINRNEINFRPAFPESIEIETSAFSLKDSSSNIIKLILQRNSGSVSDGLTANISLRDSKNNIEKKGIFFNSTKSSNGIITSTLYLDKPQIGNYNIKVFFNDSTKSILRNIQVIKK